MTRPAIKNWRFACLLTLPIMIFFAGYLFNHPGSLRPTGFIQYDNVSYVAYAKQYLDADSFHLQYSNPFNDHGSAPIYFQPQTLLFAALLEIGIPPGWLLIPFSLVCSVICFRLVIGIYDLIVERNRFRTFSIWLFAWGGGLLMLGSIIAHHLLHRNVPIKTDLFLLDPEHGWWGLSLGRSLLFSCEAYYHVLFLASVYSLLRKRWLQTLVWLMILILSQPFSGLELLGITGTWIVVEWLVGRQKIPWWFALATAGVLAFYIYYYLVYLDRYPEHHSVADQYSLNWRLGFYRLIPAYCLVGAFAIAALSRKSFRNFFENRENRFFTCWFFVAFLLANHEWFMKARQPIHFTRGYIWTSLFLLGVPALQQLNQYLKLKFGNLGLAVLAGILLLDNFSWIALHAASAPQNPDPTYITGEQKEVMNMLNSECSNRTLLVGNETISYLCTVYTKAYPWFSHPFTTPYAADKRQAYLEFVQRGKIDPSWLGRQVVFAIRNQDSGEQMESALMKTSARREKETSGYTIWKSDSLYIRK